MTINTNSAAVVDKYLLCKTINEQRFEGNAVLKHCPVVFHLLEKLKSFAFRLGLVYADSNEKLIRTLKELY